MGVDFEAIVLARRRPIEPWLEALETFDTALPKQADLARAWTPATHPAVTAATAVEAADSHVRPLSRHWIEDLAGRYGYADDGEARAAGMRAAARGAYSRDDFLTVVWWKSARAGGRAERNSVSAIDDRTRIALSAQDEVARIAALLELEGVGIPVASALLHFAFPDCPA